MKIGCRQKKERKTNRAFNQTEKHLSRSSTLIFFPLLLLLYPNSPLLSSPLSTAPLLWCSSEVNQNLLPTLPRCSSSTCNIVLCMFTMLGVNYIEYTHTLTYMKMQTHTHTQAEEISNIKSPVELEAEFGADVYRGTKKRPESKEAFSIFKINLMRRFNPSFILLYRKFKVRKKE